MPPPPHPAPPLVPLAVRSYPLWRSELAGIRRTAHRRFGRPAGAPRLALAVPSAAAAGVPRLRVGGVAVGTAAGPAQLRCARGDHLAVRGPGDGDLPWPADSQALDVELGIGVVIAHDLEGDRTPLDCVGGFVVAVTVVARDLEHAALQSGPFTAGGGRDVATVLADEVVPVGAVDPFTCPTRLVVDGEVWATASTAGPDHDLAAVLDHAARTAGLHAGELLVLTAVPGGSGAAVDRWLSPGEEAEATVGGIGTLTLRVGRPQPWLRPGPLERHRWTVVERHGNGPDRPSPDPTAWTPPPVPQATGALAVNTDLDDVEVWPLPGGTKPEDVVVDRDGRIITGVEDGRIVRFAAGGATAEVIADTHGRPLGIEVTAAGDLIVCDADRGLLRIPVADDGTAGPVEPLVTTVGGVALRFTNNAAVAADGTVYFTDSSTRFGVHDYRQDLLEHRGNGRLLAWRPGAAGAELLLDGLHFPNGVALTPDEQALVFVETATYQVNRYVLGGPRAGEHDRVGPTMLGFPDNVAPASDGTFWVALPDRRNAMLDAVLPRPAVRRLVARLPEAVQPQPERYSLVQRVDADGTVLQTLHGGAGRYAMVTGVREHDGWLYLGSLTESGVGRVRLPGR